MQRWYVQFKDQLIGPCSEAEIIKNIKLDKIPSRSYLCREGETDWTPALDTEFCMHYFLGEQMDMEVDIIPERQWVVLQAADGGDYEQDGPFATREILSKIALGELDYSDRIWRPGFQTWERIGELSNFVPSGLMDERINLEEEQAEQKVLLSEEGSDELLGSVARFEGRDILEYAQDVIPEEAKGADLTKARERFNQTPSQDEINQMSFSMSENKKAAAAQPSVEEVSRWIPKNLRVEGLVANMKSNFSRVFAVGVLLLLVGFLMKHFVVIEPTTTLEAKEKQKSTDLSSFKKPSLRIYGLALNSMRPRLEIRSNYDREDQVKLEIIGREGKILNHFRFSIEKELVFVPGENMELYLSEDQLADGLYTIRASLGNLKAEKEIFIGVNDIQFESKLKQFNMQKKKRLDLEKKILKKVAGDLEKRSSELLKTIKRKKLSKLDWKSFYNSWKRKFYESAHTELRSFSPETENKFVNVTGFRKLKELRLELWKASKEIKANKRSKSLSGLTKINSKIQKL